MASARRISLNLESLEPRMLLSAPPVVTDPNIAAFISTDLGTAGIAGISDVITVTWNNSPTGDNNSDIAGVTADMSAFGGPAAATMKDDGTGGDVTAGDGIWTATYTVQAGNIDAANLNASVTATDTSAQYTTAADTSNITVDNVAPVVTDPNIAAWISTDAGTVGVAGIGDVITVAWDNSAGGDNNSDIADVTANLSAFGGSATATMNDSGTGGDVTAGDGVWTVQYTEAAGSINAAGLNASVTATNSAGNSTTTADTSNIAVDNVAPVVTDPNIAAQITTDAGTVGVANIGDVITVAWNNKVTGDDNADITSVTADMSAFGGPTAVAMNDNGTGGDAVAGDGIWGVSYTVAVGNIDATGLHASVTATNSGGNSTTAADTTNIAVNNVDPGPPTVTDQNIVATISTDAGTAGVANIGDVIKVTWNNSPTGDNNSNIASVTANLSAFGGPAAATMHDDGTGGDATAGDGIWTATYTVQPGNINTTNLNASVTATDTLAESTTTADTSNLAVDNAPVATYTAGTTVVSAYDVTDSGTFDKADIKVKFLQDDGVRSITLRGSSDMSGLGLVISGAPDVGHIRDHRSGDPSDISFIASDSSIRSVKLQSGATGFNLNGQTFGGLTFAADVDGDGSTTDATAFYDTDSMGLVKLHGGVTGDVMLAGTGATGDTLGKWILNGGNMTGDMNITGNAGKIRVYGGNLGGDVTVTGNLHKLAIAERGGTGGALVAGTDVTVEGQLMRGHVDSYATDDNSVTYGLTIGSLGDQFRAGSKVLTPSALPFTDGDFEVAKA